MSYQYEEMSWSDVRDLFRKWREDNERRSDEVIQLWEAVLEDRISKTGNERHLILEQVAIAALDTRRMFIAIDCISELKRDFPDSLRVMKLNAMYEEAVESYDVALTILDKIIAKDETNAAARKRKVAIFKAMRNHVDAIKELNEYLKKFMSDVEAWHELCNLYMTESDYSKALFCMEEVLLHNPHSHLIHQRVAEIRYTMGGMENIELAKTYYSQAIKLNPNNLRALYGLYLCCNQIANSKMLVSKRKDAQKLAQWALEQATARTMRASKLENNDKLIAALDGAFANMDIKSSSVDGPIALGN